MTDTNHYETLEVRDFASAEVVRGAYKHLSQRWHPDKNPDDPVRASAMTTAINAAYFVLSDPDRRSSFDNELRARQRRQSSVPPLRRTQRAGQITMLPRRHLGRRLSSAARSPSRFVRLNVHQVERASIYIFTRWALPSTEVFHFDLAGPGWGGVVLVIAALGMSIGSCRPSNEGGIRVLLVTGVVCVLVAFFGRLNPVEPSVEPLATASPPPVAAIDNQPTPPSSSASESLDRTSAAIGSDFPSPSQEPTVIRRVAEPTEALCDPDRRSIRGKRVEG